MDHGDKKYFYVLYQSTINFGVLRAYCIGVNFLFTLTFLDKWRHKIVNSIDQGIRQQLTRQAGVLMGS